MSSSRPRTVTTRVVTEINRTAILDALITHGPLSRRQIVERTGLGSATVERLCAALLADRRIVVDGMARSPGGGRPSDLLRHSGSSRAVVAIDVADRSTRGRLVDLDGRVLAEDSDPLEAQAGALSATRRLDGAVALAERLTSRAATLDVECAGIGLSAPGIVHEGTVTNTVEIGWREVPLGAIVADRTGIRTIVENDANAIAFGEWSRGAAAGVHSMAAYVIGAGVGAGIVEAGRIHRGARSAAGEIGFLLADTAALGRYFTERGDLETRIGEVVGAPGSADDIDALLSPSAAADPALAPRAAALFDLIAFSCGAITTLLDPEVILFAGHGTRSPGHAAAEVSRRLRGRIPFPPRFIAGVLGNDAAMIGISELVTREVRDATYIA